MVAGDYITLLNLGLTFVSTGITIGYMFYRFGKLEGKIIGVCSQVTEIWKFIHELIPRKDET